MRSLKTSMTWDEEVFGLEYDLDVFNIAAVSDFNMGAMENKGLNVFNTKYVLAQAGDRDRRRLPGHRDGHRARIFPQLDRQPRHLPRLVPAVAEGRADGLSRPGVLGRPGQPRGEAHRRRAGAARGAVPRGCRPAGASGAAGPLHRDRQFLYRDGLQQGRRGHPHDGDDHRARGVPPRHGSVFRAARQPGGHDRRFRRRRCRTRRASI